MRYVARELAPAGLRSSPSCERFALKREQAPSPRDSFILSTIVYLSFNGPVVEVVQCLVGRSQLSKACRRARRRQSVKSRLTTE
ncbi:hypothetical protein EMIT043CA1_140143 [Pseudomonas brassicacearum]